MASSELGVADYDDEHEHENTRSRDCHRQPVLVAGSFIWIMAAVARALSVWQHPPSKGDFNARNVKWV